MGRRLSRQRESACQRWCSRGAGRYLSKVVTVSGKLFIKAMLMATETLKPKGDLYPVCFHNAAPLEKVTHFNAMWPIPLGSRITGIHPKLDTRQGES
ncbi:hypothetical protein CEXT_716221 [Caerostris extrusa]|uniref:Uncharacterized protein n=1 Tax=Caerostris extrusa TaxID=172846 RepID=A0AAV4QRS5_CAEEX|nr:hypothetical protein CEXT_716221 [Caerostris extrusa]